MVNWPWKMGKKLIYIILFNKIYSIKATTGSIYYIPKSIWCNNHKNTKFTLSLFVNHFINLIKQYLTALFVGSIQANPLVGVHSVRECRTKYLNEKDTCLKFNDLLQVPSVSMSFVCCFFLGNNCRLSGSSLDGF